MTTVRASPTAAVGRWAELPLGDHVLAESPRWDARRRRLSWVDLMAGTVSWAFHDGRRWGTVERRRVGRMPTAAEPFGEGEGWQVCVDGAVVVLPPDGPPAGPVAVTPDFPEVRTNDATRAPDGRLLVGLFAEDRVSARGGVVAVEAGGTVEPVVDGLVTANGMAVTPDGAGLLVVDTARATVTRAPLAGGASEVLVRYEGVGRLDGLALGMDDDVWVAVWDAGVLLRLALDGRLLGEVRAPVARPTAVAVADLNGPHLVVTTARSDLRPGPPGPDPAGRLYAAPLAPAGST